MSEAEHGISETYGEFIKAMLRSSNPEIVKLGMVMRSHFESGKKLQRVLGNPCGSLSGDSFIQQLEATRQALLDHSFDTGELIAALKAVKGS